MREKPNASAMWWLGQAIAVFLGISAIGASGSITVGLIVVFALAVLVDIRELVYQSKKE